MPKISDNALREVEKALQEHRAELDSSDLSLNTKNSHHSGARTFVRWLADNYKVGQGLDSRR